MPGALTFDIERVHTLASTLTRLADPGDEIARDLINWGYAIADSCIRAHYDGPILQDSSPQWPLSPGRA